LEARSVQQLCILRLECTTRALASATTDTVLRLGVTLGRNLLNLADNAVCSVCAGSTDSHDCIVRLEGLSAAQVVEAWDAKVATYSEISSASIIGGRVRGGGRHIWREEEVRGAIVDNYLIALSIFS